MPYSTTGHIHTYPVEDRWSRISSSGSASVKTPAVGGFTGKAQGRMGWAQNSGTDGVLSLTNTERTRKVLELGHICHFLKTQRWCQLPFCYVQLWDGFSLRLLHGVQGKSPCQGCSRKKGDLVWGTSVSLVVCPLGIVVWA